MQGEKQRRFAQHGDWSLETLVPAEDFYRRLEAGVDLSFIREMVKGCYSADKGCPSIDPVVYFKLQLIKFFEGIRSERQLLRQVDMNLAWRWYVGYDLGEALPDHSSLSKIRQRYGVEVFEGFFDQILGLCKAAGMVWGEEVHVDSTGVAANASVGGQLPRFYVETLAPQRPPAHTCLSRLRVKYHAPQPVVTPHPYERQRDWRMSPIDPDASPGSSGRLGYRVQYVVDGGRARLILACLVTPQATQDHMPLVDLVAWVRFHWHLPLRRVVADTRYGTAANVLALEQTGLQPYLPLYSTAVKDRQLGGKFPPAAFRYDPITDTYRCPADQTLVYSHSTTTRRVYQAPTKVCAACPQRPACTASKTTGRKVSHLSVKPQLDQLTARLDPALFAKLQRKRLVWIEPKFGELKLWHQGARFTLRGLENVTIETFLRAAGQNLKQLLKHLARAPRCPAPSPTPLTAALPFFSLPLLPFFQHAGPLRFYTRGPYES